MCLTLSLMPSSPPLWADIGDVGLVIRSRRLALLGHVARLYHAVPAWKALRRSESQGWHRAIPWVASTT